MTPREFDSAVVQTRLGLLTELFDDLEGVGEVTSARLTEDRIMRHAVERVLTQVVELVASVNGHVAATLLRKAPQDYRSSFTLAAKVGLIDEALTERAERDQRAAAGQSRAVVRALLDQGLSGADAARILKVSPQRISQLANSA